VLHLMGRGREEFCDTDLEAAGRPSFRVSFSAGVAMLSHGATVDEWKKAADDALYASKAAGRNRITAAVASPTTWCFVLPRRRGRGRPPVNGVPRTARRARPGFRPRAG